MKFDVGQVRFRKSGRLPHWDVEHGIYFVTFNLFDALPQSALVRIQDEARAQAAHIQHSRGALTIAEQRGIDASIAARIGDCLDESHGECFLRQPRIAKVVAEALVYFDLQRYVLYGWAVMPSHVHVIFRLLNQASLGGVLRSWKSFTAKRANRMLGRTGDFWQEGYFDRTIRNSRELERTIEYVLANPANAGLKAWEFVRAYPERVGEVLQPVGTTG